MTYAENLEQEVIKLRAENKRLELELFNLRHEQQQAAAEKKEIEEKPIKTKIVAFSLWKEETLKFSSIEAASKRTCVPTSRIMHCIRTGQKWRGWNFEII